MVDDARTLELLPETEEEPLHVSDWLALPASYEGERLAKEWLNKFSIPAYDKRAEGIHEWLAALGLTCEWRGKRYCCRW